MRDLQPAFARIPVCFLWVPPSASSHISSSAQCHTFCEWLMKYAVMCRWSCKFARWTFLSARSLSTQQASSVVSHHPTSSSFILVSCTQSFLITRIFSILFSSPMLRTTCRTCSISKSLLVPHSHNSAANDPPPKAGIWLEIFSAWQLAYCNLLLAN